jgi:exodeoxyribonuclease V gamma subunit
MPLAIHFVRSLAEVVQPAADFLSRPADDLFARHRIVVPHAGAKAWLAAELAKELGARRRNGQSLGDGIVANVEISFPGTIMSLLQPRQDPAKPDPWAFDRLTFAVLDVITADEATGLRIPFNVSEEPLLAARRIAGLLDEYHVRRPGMICEWGMGNAVLAPTANDEQKDDVAMALSLRESDKWQFRVWRAVRDRLGKDQPPPPLRQSVGHQPNHERLLVAGLEALSLPQLMSLERLGDACDVEAFVIHPSPGLRSVWQKNGQQPLPDKLRDRPLQKRREPEFHDGVDPLLPAWLAGARELQELLAARGATVTAIDPPADQSGHDSLIRRMQRTILAGGDAERLNHDPKTDRSVLIHRCHSLSRQAEVLHESLLQAFEECDGLEPHEVAVVSPCIDKAAPHLEAVFQRTVLGRDTSGTKRKIKLPLVVADRGIRETSEAADLMMSLLALPGSRGSIDDVLAVASHPLVRAAFGISDDTVATWTDLIERTAIRWGFDADHRARRGLVLEHNADVHTWKLGLERMLLGAMLPDAEPQPEVGGVVPLDDVDLVDLAAISKLARILDVIHALEVASVERCPAGDWCDAIEQALVGLCGAESPQLAEPLALLRRLRNAAAGTVAEKHAVPFHDVHQLLIAWLDEKAGRQPLRTGAITASSMVPLRGVPFKVVCVIGYDDGAVGAGEADGDDLVSRQQLVGDGDPRTDERRALLDCLLAAQDRLIITCNGRNVKSNKQVPLVTPLAEFVDFAVRHGVAREKYDEASRIEIHHPRHHLSRRNFEEAGVEPTGIWSHDAIASEVLKQVEEQGLHAAEGNQAEGCGQGNESAGASVAVHGVVASDPAIPILTELSLLERMVKDPLSLYLKETLGIDTWREDDEPTPATVPLSLEKKQSRLLTLELHEKLVLDPSIAEAWIAAKQRSGILPVGPHAQRHIAEIRTLAEGLKQGAEGQAINLSALINKDLDGLLLGRHRLVGSLKGIHEGVPRQLVYVMPGEIGLTSYGRPLHVAGLHLLAACAAGIELTLATIISRRDGWRLGKMKKTAARQPQPRPEDAWQTRVVKLAPHLMEQAAAAKRLDAIAALAHEARQFARPAFGKVLTTDADKREQEFENTLATDFYARTGESALFGVSPTFTDVFADHPERVAFLDAWNRGLSLNHVKTGGGHYLLT